MSASHPSARLGLGGHAVVAWGVLGFALILVNAIVRLTPLAVEPIRAGSLAGWQVALYATWVVGMAWSEGYRAFHKQVSPRVVARGMYLARNRRALHVALAPLFCMSLIFATRRRLIVSWSVLTGIVVLVIAVRHLPQPWRGIVDGGVVVGLGWGVVAMLVYYVRALAGHPMPVPPEVPEDSGREATA